MSDDCSEADVLLLIGHQVDLYERYDFAGEVGASLSCAMNGTQWLEHWKVDVAAMRPVILETLCMHDVSRLERPLNDDAAHT